MNHKLKYFVPRSFTKKNDKLEIWLNLHEYQSHPIKSLDYYSYTVIRNKGSLVSP